MVETLETPLQVMLRSRDIGPYLTLHGYHPTEQQKIHEQLAIDRKAKVKDLTDLEVGFLKIDVLHKILKQHEEVNAGQHTHDYLACKADLNGLIRGEDKKIEPLLTKVMRRYNIRVQAMFMYDARDMQHSLQLTFAA